LPFAFFPKKKGKTKWQGDDGDGGKTISVFFSTKKETLPTSESIAVQRLEISKLRSPLLK